MTEKLGIRTKHPSIEGEFARHGRRKWTSEIQITADGTKQTVRVPYELYPIESNLLTGIDYITQTDPEQPDVDLYSLVRQLDPNIAPTEGFTSFYTAIFRLRDWGYLASRREMPSSSDKSILRVLYRLTNAGRQRLERDGQTQN